MFKYNDNNIFVGYIKQLLSSFNYPDMDIYSTKIIPCNNNFYLYNNKISYYKDGEFNEVTIYSENRPLINLTKSFNNKSFIYDEETHLWLGKYLRFLRDYKKLDLMSLYNCFTNELVKKVTPTLKDNFNPDDSNYFIYSIPLKLFEKYSLYIECAGKIEIKGTIGKEDNPIELKLNNILSKKVSNSNFKTPIIIDSLDRFKLESEWNQSEIEQLYRERNNLKILLKVPSSTKSSIVLLEGIYPNSNDFTLSNTISNLRESGDESYPIMKDLQIKGNHSINNYEYAKEGLLNEKFISPLELLYINSGVSHPFSDRLIEYLLDNPVTNIESIPDNIKRIQKALQQRWYDIKNKKHTKLGMATYSEYGKWEPRIRNTLYDIEVSNNNLGYIKDILGYLDKDVEKQLGQEADIYTTKDGGYDL